VTQGERKEGDQSVFPKCVSFAKLYGALFTTVQDDGWVNTGYGTSFSDDLGGDNWNVEFLESQASIYREENAPIHPAAASTIVQPDMLASCRVRKAFQTVIDLIPSRLGPEATLNQSLITSTS
jgi:hypothetical protein